MPVFETPGSVSLHIRLPSGRVVVTAADEPRTTVELVARGRRGTDALEDIVVRADERPGGHDVTIEQQDRFRWGPIQISWGRDIEVRITCPPGSDLQLSGGSTELRAEVDLGEVEVKTASGDVRLGSARGKLDVKTASGDVSVDTVEAAGSLVTVSGDLRVGALHDKVTARTVSGDVEIQTVRAPLTLSTTSGDIELDSVEAGEVRIQSVSGDVRIGVGRGTRVWIDAVSVSGDLGSELGLEDATAASEEDEGEVVPLQVKTVSGDVSVVRAAETISS